MTYDKGHLSTVANHIGKIGEYLFTLPADNRVLITVKNEEEAKTLQQLRLIHSVFMLLHLSNCMPERIDCPEKVKEYFKIKCGMIKDYGYFDKNNRLNYTKEIDTAREHDNWYPRTITLAKATKKALKELIEYTMNFADKQNMHGNLGSQEKKYILIREELDYRRN